MLSTAADDAQRMNDAFIELEERCGCWDLEAFGQRYWHQIRFPVFNLVRQSLGLMDRPQRSWRHRPVSSWLANVRPSHWGPAVQRSTWRWLEPADLLVINHPRLVRRGDLWVCPYTYPLMRGLRTSHWVIEDVQQGIHPHPQPGFRLKYLEWQFLLAQLGYLARHGSGRGRLNAKERDGVRAWCAELKETFGGGPSEERALGMTRAAVRELVAFKGLYGRLLDSVKPKLIVLVVNYSYRCVPMTRMARERGIPVAELQHGVMGQAVLPYNFAAGRRPDTFPNYLLTFGDWWRDQTPRLPLARSQAPAIGYAWLEDHPARRRASGHRDRPTVLVVSQGTIGPKLSKIAVELSKQVGSAYRIRYKLHPGELLGWKDRYPWLDRSSIEVIDQLTDVYEEFVRADVVVGVYSTAIYEAVAFGLPVLLVDLAGIESAKALIETGGATACSNVDELRTALSSAEPPSEAVRQLLWRPGAVDNFRAFVEQAVAKEKVG